MNIFAFLAYSIVVTFTPGPANIMIFSTTQNYGYKQALKFVAGASLAFFLLLIFATAANSFMLDFIPGIEHVMGIIGALYMLYLAYKIFNMDIQNDQNQSGGFMTGFIMQFINPKAVMFTLTVIGSFVTPYYTAPMDIALFVAILAVIGCCAYSSWVVLGALFSCYMQSYQKQANIILSVTMIYCAYAVSGI
ncbi:LysE family translocator [Maridesulfovibrio zosterae]|uniref:LysE family translocator n=1 Tax=Maridesulfovibrio zosterae TaxID=82171 RepID=UPI0004057B38|nr:LysE family transporter [Maridesulfovibrio zosterae]